MRALAAWLIPLCGCHIVAGYDDMSFEDRPPEGGVVALDEGRITRIDLLLMIDNSRSMADKQQILERAVPDLVDQLINPPCVDATGVEVADQPAGPLDACPPDSARVADPISDIHIGVISSSIGTHGADACTALPTENDHAHLITRAAEPVATYADHGFLAWDPLAQKDPPGESDGDVLAESVRRLVVGAGETGCGYEAPLESWYRFLVDPDPYAEVVIDGGAMAQLVGTDTMLLAQRRAFLRPDSLLAIVMLTDENDCSIRSGGQFYFAAQFYSPGTGNPYHLWRPRAACATDPLHPCCVSCAQPPPPGCDDSNDDCSSPLSEDEDNINVRCFDQKRRFGIDFLWPLERYVTGLTASSVPDRFGQLHPNPLYVDLNPDDDIDGVRSPGLVYLAGIVGVPWQDLARENTDGDPDLTLGFKSAEELHADERWDLIAGDLDTRTPPQDPLMVESIAPRSGVHPITGDPLAPPDSGFMANPINGHEYSIPANNDLQYACIMPLDTPRDCAEHPSCDCGTPAQQNPLCQNPDTGAFEEIQYAAKAYPALRQLSVLRDIGGQAIVASICPAQLTTPTRADYGYRPAVASLLEKLERQLDVQFCLEDPLLVQDGRVGCTVIEGRTTDVGACDCSAEARHRLEDAHLGAVQQIKNDDPSLNCFCGVTQADGPALTACRTVTSEPVVDDFGYLVHGWCYVDVADDPVHAPAFTEKCDPTRQRGLRFVGAAQPTGDARLFLTCPR